MTEEFGDYGTDEINSAPVSESAPSWTTEAAENFDAQVDPTKYFRFITTGDPFYVPVINGEPMTLAAALTSAGRVYNAASIFEMDGAPITPDTMLQPGCTVIAISSTKGG